MLFRRIACALLALLLLPLPAGCARNGSLSPGDDRNLTVVTSFFPIYIATINVTRGVSGISVVNMTEPQTGCLHDYQLTAEDMKTLEKANAFVINGAGMEAFMDKVVKAQQNIRIVDSGAGIPLVKDATGVDNPHIWVSISNEIQQVENIAKGLSEINPENKAKYETNAQEYEARLKLLRNRMHSALDGLKNRDIITMHEAFAYFASEFNLHVAAVIEREPGTDPTPKELAGIIDTVNGLGITALFAEPQYSTRAADAIARETNAKVWTLDPAVTGDARPDNFDAYIAAMEKNMDTLAQALK